MCGLVAVEDWKGSEEDAYKSLEKIVHRGPDDSRVETAGAGFLGFCRLAIRDLTDAGNQPFLNLKTQDQVVCNGEIYNDSAMKELVSYDFTSASDCEVLLPLYRKFGLEKMNQLLDGEYAFVIYDASEDCFKAARDPMGIRPLFYGYDKSGSICFASEVKAIEDICDDIKPFPPGFYFDGKDFKQYLDITAVKEFQKSLPEALFNIRDLLTKAVHKRLQSDAPVGFLLSGGLDSSLVCSIAASFYDKPIKTFAVGMEDDAIDLKYARDVARHIGSDHTEVIITKEDVLKALPHVIYHLESWDITTVRASTGMYLLCEWIKENTDIKVLLTGEVSDELFGYKYTDFAPTPEEFQKESEKRINELYLYDVLRADRCLAAHSLEARVPFSDKDFVNYVMSICPKLKMNSTGIGKYLLRKAFEVGNYLPEHILYREKAAFSDAVGHSMVDYIKEHANDSYTEAELIESPSKYPFGTPFTKESLLFRDIFESFYKERSQLIVDFWMPNKEWENCDVVDPSARALPNYGASGI
jgi:asparagine synthase (glutamine-hydrolysing)